VVVSKEGYDDYRQSVTIEPGKPFTVNASLPARAEPSPQTPAMEAAVAKVTPSKKESVPPGAVTRIGQLLVTANVSGARISVDGASEPNWITPYSSTIDLPTGTYQVVVSKEGYEDSQRSVTIEAGKTSKVNVPLSVGSGEVMIVTTPPGLEVFIDGKSIGLSPAHTAVVAGSHSYSVTRPGETPYEGTVNVKSGAMPVIRVSMNRPGEGTTGIVSVNTIPPGATVVADGKPAGGPTPTSFRLTAGPHTLIISLSGHRSVERVIEVRIGEPLEERVDMSHQ
jgi:hypothetical protein